MTVALVALSITVALLAAALVTGGAWAHRRVSSLRQARDASGYRALVGRRVTANVTDGGAIRGVLTAVYTDAIVIAHPEYVGTSRPAGIGAEVTLARSSVPMLQRFDDQPAAVRDVSNIGG